MTAKQAKIKSFETANNCQQCEDRQQVNLQQVILSVHQ
jgi:hypothetical protein